MTAPPSSQKVQYPLTREYTLNHIKDPCHILRYITESRDIGLSGLIYAVQAFGVEDVGCYTAV